MAESSFSRLKSHFQRYTTTEFMTRISKLSESQTRAASSIKTYNFKSKFNRRSILVKGALLFIGGACYELYVFRRYFLSTLPEDPASVGSTKRSQYIYESDPMHLNIPSWKSYLMRLKLPILTTHCREAVWHYVLETNSKDPTVRDEAIRLLAGLNGLTDIECYSVSSSVSFKTGVALANSAADPRLIPVPRGVEAGRVHLKLPDRMRHILLTLPQKNIHPEVLSGALRAIAAYDPTIDEYYENQLELATSFDSDMSAFTNPIRRPAENDFLIPCLNAILSHTRLLDQIPAIGSLGVLEVLAVIAKRHRDDIAVMSIIVKIISNMTWHPNAAEYIEDAGMLRLISELSLDADIRLNLPARKALHNLDKEGRADPSLPPGVFQLYPSFRFDERKLDVDIIFVHGLMGGVFRTWRRHDNAYNDAEYKECPNLDTRDRAYHLRLRGERKGPSIVDIDLEAELEEQSKSVWAERMRSIRNKIPFTYGPKLKLDKETEYKPANREYRDGVLYYFQDHEKIALDIPTDLPTVNTKCWPKDWLPDDVKSARVIALDFETFVTQWNTIHPIESFSRSLSERSEEILGKLLSAGVGKRPIIWVAHSAGGLLVKRLLIDSSRGSTIEEKSLSENTEGIIFYSTPHFGSQFAAMNTAGKLFLLPTMEIKELNPDSEELKSLNDNFLPLIEKHNYHVVSFGEMAQTISNIGIPLKLVSLKSSDPGFGEYFAVDLNHLDICKPTSRGSFIYRKLVEVVMSIKSTSQKFQREKPDE